MEELWEDAADVEWTCVRLEGTPMLVIQATGPAMSSELLMREFTALKLRYTFDPVNGQLVPKTFVCYNADDFMHPVLATDADPRLQAPLLDVGDNPWLLALQVVVDGQQQTRLWVTENGATTVLTGPDGLSIIPHWICQLR